MRKKMKRGFVMAGGVVFLALGIIGLVLPFLQGILFLAIGLILLSLVSPKVRAFLDVHTIRYPHIHRAILQVEGWVVRLVGET